MTAARRIIRHVSPGRAAFERVVFTRNSRVMASTSDRGRTLRVHEMFIHAPPDVLRALGECLVRRPSAKRTRARALVRSFVSDRLPSPPPAAARPPRRTPAPIPPADRPIVQRLQTAFDRVNARYFDGTLPTIPIRLSGRMRTRLGHFCSDPLEIVLSRALFGEAAREEAEETLRHEMIHLWQWHTGAKPGHGADFRRMALALSITPRAVRHVCWRDD